MQFKTVLIMGILLIVNQIAIAQNGWQTLDLNDMKAFQPQAGNWQIVGEVLMNRNIDIHQKLAVPALPEQNSNKKKKKSPPAIPSISNPEPEKSVIFQAGQGILLNQNTENQKDNLMTVWQHADIELELELMLPQGSNSGIYLQGAYELQLFDSWGINKPTFADMGGIYRNWEKSPEIAYAGKAPLRNAAKAPGLWQTLKIAFQAPKLDAQGKKIANARFLWVELNGIKIHENVEVPQMTGGSRLKKESSEGPLMIQGDHGAVAFRNIRYRLLKESKVSLANLNYQVFDGKFAPETDFSKLKPSTSGSVEKLTWQVAQKDTDFALHFKGVLKVSQSGNYSFGSKTQNYFKLVLNEKVLIDYGKNSSGPIQLTNGDYPLEVIYFKNQADSWRNAYFGLWVESPHTYSQALHSVGSLPPTAGVVSPIYVEVGNAPKLLRAFLDYKQDRTQRLTHTLAVGHPSHIHYIYDLNTARLVGVWRGDFLDATPMWHDRGDGSFRPRGLMQYLSKTPTWAILADSLADFPAEYSAIDFKTKGYVLDKEGNPSFKSIYKNIEITDQISILPEGKGVQHWVEVRENAHPALYYKLAEGKSIQLLKDGSYAIDDKKYYLEVKSTHKPMIRSRNGSQELIVKVSESMSYVVIW
jgi:hypothetical protein